MSPVARELRELQSELRSLAQSHHNRQILGTSWTGLGVLLIVVGVGELLQHVVGAWQAATKRAVLLPLLKLGSDGSCLAPVCGRTARPV